MHEDVVTPDSQIEMGWFYLFIAIVFEVIGTAQLKRTEGNFFSTPGMLMLLFYAISFFLLTMALKNNVEVGTGYAIWSGVGTALIAIIGVVAFQEQATLMKFLCISLIIIGVVGLKINSDKSKPVATTSQNLFDNNLNVTADVPIENSQRINTDTVVLTGSSHN